MLAKQHVAAGILHRRLCLGRRGSGSTSTGADKSQETRASQQEEQSCRPLYQVFAVQSLDRRETCDSLRGQGQFIYHLQLYVDTGTEYDIPFGHRFAGYYLPFPGTQHEGLVSTIMDDPPIM
ncbi:hypothetical protein diail_230 [Diaporthe ilicicola]|nr:hypothetical protein diail_230 [Diaporthe ilicicola]